MMGNLENELVIENGTSYVDVEGELQQNVTAGESGPHLESYPVSSGLALITMIAGITGNTLLIYLSFLKSKLMTVINQLLLVQCLINMSECLVLIPIRSILMASALSFPQRNQLCRFILSWTYANWANFCLSLTVMSSVRLLYLMAPLKMHSIKDAKVVNASRIFLGLSQLTWFISSMLVEERPFGSAACMTEKYEPASIRISLSVIFNLSCVLVTLSTYVGITLSFSKHSLSHNDRTQKNVITVRTGLIQAIFLLLTFLMPLVTRLLSYRGLISHKVLAQGNMLWVNFTQCAVYPFLTVFSSSILRREVLKFTAPLLRHCTHLPRMCKRRFQIEPMVNVSVISKESQLATYELTSKIKYSRKHLVQQCEPVSSTAENSLSTLETTNA